MMNLYSFAEVVGYLKPVNLLSQVSLHNFEDFLPELHLERRQPIDITIRSQ